MRKVQAYAVTETRGLTTKILSLSFRTHDKNIVKLIVPNDERNISFDSMNGLIRYILTIAKMNDYSIPFLFYDFGVKFYDITFIDVAFPEPTRYGYFEEV